MNIRSCLLKNQLLRGYMVPRLYAIKYVICVNISETWPKTSEKGVKNQKFARVEETHAPEA